MDTDIRRIIVIDDNPDVHQDYATILTAKGTNVEIEALEQELFGGDRLQPPWHGPQFELEFAHQGQQGVAKIKQALSLKTPFQLAFVDMRMPPGWDGLKTFLEIRKIDPRLQTVLCTAYSDYTWEEIHHKLGFCENLLILKKPFDSLEVAQMASTLTHKWFLSRQAKIKRDELENLVDERTRALRDSNAHLRQEIKARKELEEQLVRVQKLEAIGTLAAGVAHDFNNLLHGIQGRCSLIRLTAPEDKTIGKHLDQAEDNIRNAASLTDRLLGYARSGKHRSKVLDFNRLVEQNLETLNRTCKQIRIDQQLAPNLASICGDRFQLDQMIANLCVNAFQAMPGGGDLKIVTGLQNLDPKEACALGVAPGPHVVLKVSDTGHGIAPEIQDKIFDPFFTTRPRGRGTGLGLASVHRIVKNHRGGIRVDSCPGQGATFTVYLSAVDQPATEKTAGPACELHRGNACILLVDDEQPIIEVGYEMLKALGYQVLTADGGHQAIDICRQRTNTIELVILDLIMPDMGGEETFVKLRQICPWIPVVVSSGYSRDAKTQRILDNGGRGFLQKPFDLQSLSRTLDEVLRLDPPSCEFTAHVSSHG